MRPFLSLLLCLGSLWLFAQKPITVEDIWQKGTFQAKGVPGFNFQKDGVHYTRLEGGSIVQYDLRNGERSGLLFDASALGASAAPGWSGAFDAYTFSADEAKILLQVGTEPIYRWSSKADFFVYDLNKKKMQRLHEGGQKQRYACFSPDASKVAFEMGNDLYIKDLNTEKTTRVSTDGRPNAIINGASDWVYEEEFELVRAFEWSPDGQQLAFLRFDESAVPEMSMEMYRGGTYPELVTFKYPKVGEKNAQVTAHCYNLAKASTQRMDIPDRAADLDDYLPRLAWTPAGEICLRWMNRHQNTQRLWLADPISGNCRLLQEERDERYLDLHDVVFLADGSGFVAQSEKSGFNHLYRYDMRGKQVAALTKGDWDVTDFYGVDERNGLLYFQAAAESPMQRELYSANLKGKKRKKLSSTQGWNGAQWSNTFDYQIHTFSTANTPPQYAVRDRTGKLLRLLESNSPLQSKQLEHRVAPVEFFDFKTSENVALNGWMIKPSAPEFQQQKLPLLMFVYGGPGSQQVTDQWRGANYWWFQMLAQQGYVVACVDNRGTGGRGADFKKMTYKQLGHYEVADQIEAAKYLGSQPFVDAERIGIFGWSYGGYMSSNCLLKGRDVFKAAIAVAPVTNWKWYDSVYTERYMQTHAENERGYEDNSPVNFAEQLEGQYLLVHGMADDNVHFQHTAEMANQLIAKNKHYETMIYPNSHHGISNGKSRLHLYTLMTQFLEENLKVPTKGRNAKP
jgi:dipeptidyl-peptidase-4